MRDDNHGYSKNKGNIKKKSIKENQNHNRDNDTPQHTYDNQRALGEKLEQSGCVVLARGDEQSM